MENDKIIYRSFEGFPDANLFEKLSLLYQDIFDDADLQIFEDRLKTKKDVLIIMAFAGEDLIGFKIGYLYKSTIFYSWVGGIHKDYRRIGIASELARLQETHVKNKGYHKLRTKSMNRFKPMMALNLKNGFDILDVYTNESGQTKIIFEKDISLK
ncbi:MAG: GNAT family N-acetyltransferase [Bacteroidia bacterium]|nr:GNAT family N-acetyltransferase [Bacteroidia bacterium]NND52809.1 GNAT family N-acetyltransferase [Flavobacteriaceae bacterium]